MATAEHCFQRIKAGDALVDCKSKELALYLKRQWVSVCARYVEVIQGDDAKWGVCLPC